MKRASELHDKAMARIDHALIERARGKSILYQRNLREAFQLEREAALLVARTDLEPSRSVLLRSAAALAIDSGEIEEARKLAARGLQGNPPPEIADELRATLGRAEAELAKFKELYPTVRQFFLNSDDLQHDANRLAQIAFRNAYRELRPASLPAVLEVADRVARKERRARRDRAGMRVASRHPPDPDVSAAQSRRDVDLPEPLHQALADFPDQVRRCFLMRMERLSFRQVARSLRVSVDSAKSLWDEAVLRFSNLAVPGFQDLAAIDEGGEIKSDTTRKPMVGAGHQRG
jgi:DNA-directed RNA polymerase specialized sigma24 family protein